MSLSIERVEFLLLIAAIVAMTARRLRLPYTVGLVLAGVGLAFVALPEIRLTKELIFSAFLPPLIFEAAFAIRWPELRRDLLVVVLLATVGVLLSAGITAVGMRRLAGWEWTAALLFGILIAATDPVSVIATFKEAGVQGRLRLLVEAESLLNDGTAAAMFAVALAGIEGASVDILSALRAFTVLVAGSLLCGGLIGGIALGLTGRTDDHLIEITFTTVAAYGSFLLAEHLHLSGVLATLTAGLLFGNIGLLSEKGREAVETFWEYVAFAANSLIFLLIGMRLAHQPFASMLGPMALAILLVTLGRAAAVYPLCALFAWTPLRVERRHQHILFWGGLRGALALALALGLPPQTPQRDAITTVTFAVVAFSVIVQGVTIQPLLRRLGEIKPTA
jgi:CPA1 family monovalent cation:H+ antiporter